MILTNRMREPRAGRISRVRAPAQAPTGVPVREEACCGVRGVSRVGPSRAGLGDPTARQFTDLQEWLQLGNVNLTPRRSWSK
jgi:hypothetical protein